MTPPDPARVAEAKKKPKFYVVFSPTGEAPAKVTFTTHKQAFRAAHIMAEDHPERQFFVLESASKPIIKELHP